jgi:hypothetical protein
MRQEISFSIFSFIRIYICKRKALPLLFLEETAPFGVGRRKNTKGTKHTIFTKTRTFLCMKYEKDKKKRNLKSRGGILEKK